MCLILLAWNVHPGYPLVFAGNRDEAYERPAAPADFWNDAPGIYGGRDLEKGGTWLGVARSGRFAAVTNFRSGSPRTVSPRSRGELTSGFLRGIEAPHDYLHKVTPVASDYGGFSLLTSDFDRMLCFSNRSTDVLELPAGVHGLSNHLINTPWPKVTLGKQRVATLLHANESDLIAGLFDALGDRTRVADAQLPDSGVGLQRERELSPAFITSERYGTRASTVLLVSREGEAIFIERRFGALGVPLGETTVRFPLQGTRKIDDVRVTKAAGQDV